MMLLLFMLTLLLLLFMLMLLLLLLVAINSSALRILLKGTALPLPPPQRVTAGVFVPMLFAKRTAGSEWVGYRTLLYHAVAASAALAAATVAVVTIAAAVGLESCRRQYCLACYQVRVALV